MNKLKRIFLLTFSLVTFIFLAACSQTKTAHLKMSGGNGTGTDFNITLEYQEDKLLKHTTTISLLYKEADIKDSDAAKEYFKEATDQVKGLKGVSHKADYQKDRAALTLEIDLSKADLEKVAPLIGLDPAIEGEHISYKESLELYKSIGFKVTDNWVYYFGDPILKAPI